ncbi:hypothetical protein ACLOJK_000093 [Asimina triloba]
MASSSTRARSEDVSRRCRFFRWVNEDAQPEVYDDAPVYSEVEILTETHQEIDSQSEICTDKHDALACDIGDLVHCVSVLNREVRQLKKEVITLKEADRRRGCDVDALPACLPAYTVLAATARPDLVLDEKQKPVIYPKSNLRQCRLHSTYCLPLCFPFDSFQHFLLLFLAKSKLHQRRRERARERLGERKKEGEEDIGREKERGITDVLDTRSGVARLNGSSVRNDTGKDRAIRLGLGLLLRLRLLARAKLGSPAPSPLFVCGGRNRKGVMLGYFLKKATSLQVVREEREHWQRGLRVIKSRTTASDNRTIHNLPAKTNGS